MLSYFKSLQPTSVFAFLITFFILKLPLLFVHVPHIAPVPNLWNNFEGFQQESIFLSVLPAQLCLLGQAVWLNYLFHHADYHEGRSMVPALYFILVTSILPQFNVLSIYTFMVFVLLLLLNTFLTTPIKENTLVEPFNAGVIGGVLCLLDIHFLLFIPFLFLIWYAIKPFRLNESLLLLFGLLFAFYVALAFSYLFELTVVVDIYKFRLLHINSLFDNVFDAVVILVVSLYLLFAFVSLKGILYSTGFKRRRSLNMLIFFFLGLVIVIIFSGELDKSTLSLLSVPLSIFFTLLMLRIRKKKLGETLNIIFVLVTFITNIVRLFK